MCEDTWPLKLILILLYLEQANLKADWNTKPLLHQCQELVKVIDDYPAKVQHSTVITVGIIYTWKNINKLWVDVVLWNL